jgi:branched-chain amino acid transport system substrate-binding protein
MKKLLVAAIISLSSITTVALAEIKVGIILGFTGPIESLTPAMRDGARLAFLEASNSGNLLGGESFTILEADSTCTDNAAAIAGAEGLVAEGVVAIMGADCSGVTKAVNASVAVPNGMIMVSPSATSPSLSSVPDNGTFWRTAPSDAKGGQVLAQIALDRGISSVAITYENSDYGKGLSEVFAGAFEAGGGVVTTNNPHENGKGDYSAEIGVLASAGGDALAVLGYLDQAGGAIVQGSLDTGAFDLFVLGDGMIGQALADSIGSDLDGSFGSVPGSTSKGATKFNELASSNGMDGTAPYVAQSYDAAALIALAIQKGGSADKKSILSNISRVANAPGIKIMAGQLSYGLQMIAAGNEIDYQGATDVEFNAFGDAYGSFLEQEVMSGSFVTIQQR